MKVLAALLGVYMLPIMATAAPPEPPQFMTAFICQVVEGHYDPGHPFYPSPSWEDKEWALDEDGLKVCHRWMFRIEDEAAALDPTLIKMVPDLSKLFACNYIAMRIPYKLEIDGEEWFTYKRGCPRPIFSDETTIDDVLYGRASPIGYTDPDCPSDCKCINEPENI